MSERRKTNRRKSFLARLSAAILSSHQKASSQASYQGSPLLPQQAVKDKSSLEGDQPSQNNEKVESKNEDIENEEPGYSSVHGFTKQYPSSQNDNVLSTPPPPVPSKIFSDIYSTINKKKTVQPDDSGKDLESDEGYSHKDKPISGLDERTASPDVCEKEVLAGGSLMKNPGSGASSSVHKQQRHKKLTRTKVPNQKHRRQKTTREKFVETQIDPSTLGHRPLPTPDFSSADVVKADPKWIEDFHQLRYDAQQADQENEALRQKVMHLLQQENIWKREIAEAKAWKQKSSYAMENNEELNRRLEKLEIDTKQEVQLLLEQVSLMKHENEILLEQLHAAQHENRSLANKYDKICVQKNSMISVQQHVKALNESQRLLEETELKHLTETEKIQQLYSSAEDEKNSLIVKVHLLKDECKKLEADNVSLKNSQAKMDKEKELILRELDVAKQHEHEADELLGSLLKMTEDVVTERDIILKKTEFQEQQRKMIQSSAMNYSMTVGQLQEHIANMRKRMKEQVQKVMISNQEKDANYLLMKQSYERQLDILRKKIAQKNTSLGILTKEKRKVELDLENVWQTYLEKQTHLKHQKANEILPKEKNSLSHLLSIRGR